MVSTYRERYGMHASSRDPLQPRVAAPPAGVRQPQDHPHRRGDQARPRRRAAPRRPRRAARLELRRRRRRGDVADAPAGGGRRLRGLQRGEPDRARAGGRRPSPSSTSTPTRTSWSTPSSCARAIRCRSSATRPRRARKLGWEPRTSFEDLIRMMVEHDLQELSAAPLSCAKRPRALTRAASRMPDLPTITVVTPSFNAAATIEETLRSVREQDYPHVEHVVVDGALDRRHRRDPRARRGRPLRVRARPRALARDEQGRRHGRAARSSAGSTPTTSTSPARCAPSARPSPRAPRPSGPPAAA